MIIQYQLFSTQMWRNDACQLDETSYDTDITQLLLFIVEICLSITYINSVFAFAKIVKCDIWILFVSCENCTT